MESTTTTTIETIYEHPFLTVSLAALAYMTICQILEFILTLCGKQTHEDEEEAEE